MTESNCTTDILDFRLVDIELEEVRDIHLAFCIEHRDALLKLCIVDECYAVGEQLVLILNDVASLCFRHTDMADGIELVNAFILDIGSGDSLFLHLAINITIQNDTHLIELF